MWPRPSRWLPEPLSSPLSSRDPGPAEASGGVGSRQAAPPTRTLNQLSMTLLLEGHRLFLNTDVVTDVRVLEPQQLSCKDPACPRSARMGRWPRAAPYRCPSPVWWGALGQSPQGPPSIPSSCHSGALPAQKAQHLASRDPQVPEKPPQGSQRGPMLPEEQGGWGPSAPSCSRGLG